DFFHEDISLDAMVEEEGDLSRGLREVDLVLSSTELWRMVEEHSAAVGDAKGLSEGDIGTADSLAAAHLNSVQPDSPLGRDAVEALLRCFSEDARRTVTAADSNAGSGGYLEHLFRYSARRLHGVEVPSEQALQYVQGRNADIAEVLLHVPGEHAERGEPLLRFAKVYGFRNIQSLLLKMKRGKAMYDFVEIMACPSGCVNGGGQLKTTAQEHPAQIAQRVANTSRYFHENMVVRDPIESPLAQLLYSSTGKISEGPFCDLSRKLLHTTYHAIPKLEVLAPLASKW
ncbi:narfl, partial [Symbiodinium microadriaticum]